MVFVRLIGLILIVVNFVTNLFLSVLGLKLVVKAWGLRLLRRGLVFIETYTLLLLVGYFAAALFLTERIWNEIRFTAIWFFL